MHFLGKNIRHLRRQFGKTQTELAAMIGKRQTTIGNWENSISEPSIEELLLLSKYFNTSLDIMIKIDLGQTNWQSEKDGSGHSFHTTDTGQLPAVAEESFTYVLREVRSLREEVEKIKAHLPNYPLPDPNHPNEDPSAPAK